MTASAEPRSSICFAHWLLRARDWQHRPEFDDLCEWWRGGWGGVCALVGIGGAGKTAIAELGALMPTSAGVVVTSTARVGADWRERSDR